MNLLHRGACGCEPNTGDGAGILIQMPDRFLRRECAAPRHRPARRRRVRRRAGLPAAETAAAPTRSRRSSHSIVERRGPAAARLARRADRRPAPRRQRALRRAASSSRSSSAAAPDDPRPTRTSSASSTSSASCFEKAVAGARRARADVRLPAEPLLQHAHLQGHAERRPDRGDVPRPRRSGRRVGAGARPPALQHEHVPVLAAGPPVPLHRPQRRDQHAARQHQLDARARGAVPLRACSATTSRRSCRSPATGQSDSATFDNVLEFLVMSGRSLPHAILMMIPEPWQNHESMSPERRAFYEYHSSLMEPWDGPASIAFTDGTVIGAVLDRNGLRPSRYYVTKDGLVVMASEVGVLDIPPENVAHQGAAAPRPDLPGRHRAGPDHRRRGDQGRARGRASLRRVAARATSCSLDDLPRPRAAPSPTTRRCCTRQIAFGYTHEDLRILLAPMAMNGEEPIGSMGTDTALAVLSEPAAAALRLLQAALRPGHEPAARPDPRGARDVDGDDDRARGQPPRAAARVVPPDRDSRPGPLQRGAGQAPPRASTRGSRPSRCPCSTRWPRARPASSARSTTLQRAGQRRRSPTATTS